jgi:Uma2 family endonuclease
MARVPDVATPLSSRKLILNVESVGLTSDQFVRLCRDNPDLRLELTARKEILIMPPNWTKTGIQNAEISLQLGIWAKADGTGIIGDSSTGFTLPNGAVRSPDASWIRRERWDALTKDQQNSFAPICPDFLVELRSHSETLLELQAKMAEYIENGTQLAWLIDPYEKQIHIYRPSLTPEVIENPATISAAALLPGFTLDLTQIW